jgi:hypothetical protein
MAASTTLAAPKPDRVATTWMPGSTTPYTLSVADDGGAAAGLATDGSLFLLDLETWNSADVTACAASVPVAVAVQSAGAHGGSEASDGGHFLWVACDDGTVETTQWLGRAFSTDFEGEVFTLDEAAEWLVVEGSDVHAVKSSGGAVTFQTMSGASDAVDDAVEVTGGSAEALEEVFFLGDSTVEGIAIWHAASELALVSVPDGEATTSGTLSADPVDASPGPNGLYLATPSGVASWLPGDADLVELLDASDPNAILGTFDADGAGWEYILVQRDDVVEVFDSESDDAPTSFSAAITAVDMVQAGPGDALVANLDGSVSLLTGRPFVDNAVLSAYFGIEGATIDLDFDVDESGDWQLRLGGDREDYDPDDATLITGGTVTSGQGSVNASFTIDDSFVEGENTLWIDFFDSAENHGWARLTFEIETADKSCPICPDCDVCPTGCNGGADAGCSSVNGSGGVLMMLLGLSLVATRRRQTALAALLAAAMLAPVEASAQERGLARFDRDTTAAWSNFEFRWGRLTPLDDSLQRQYGGGNEFTLSGGPQIFRIVEFDFSVGFYLKRGVLLGETSNTLTGTQSRLQMANLGAALTLRAHVLDEQPFVPFASVGPNWVFWRTDGFNVATGDDGSDELTVDTGDRQVGSRGGWHWQAGGQILLDWLSPRRASILEASSGINDTWLTISYRRQYAEGGGGANLSGWAFHVGLQIDY